MADPKPIIDSIRDRSARVGIIGMGYVGLPLALTFADKGFRVTGFDTDEAKINQLAAGRSYINHISPARIEKHLSSKLFEPTSEFSDLGEMTAILICVPTPLSENREPDLSYVGSTAENITPHLCAGQLVVLESTTYPGSSREVLRPILEKSGLKSGTDFYLAYSPEREDPGNPEFATAGIPKVVGGDGDAASKIACALYDEIVVETVPVSSMDVAEAVKLTENIFRSVNIALVNELKSIYGSMGVDIWEVIDAAKTKPFGYMPFYPGPGLGGHCIPIDPFYLTWRARQVGEETRFIELAGEINTAMPAKVVDTLAAALMERFEKPLGGAKILLVGLAYKKNVDDTRESPAFALIEQMEERGAQVDYFDPYVAEIPPTREHDQLTGRKSIEWTQEGLSAYDAALICTDHDNVDYQELVAESGLVIDTRGIAGRLTQRTNVVDA